MQAAIKAYKKSNRDQLIADSTDYVNQVIYKLISQLPNGVDIENLRQAGLYGLVKAADRFDPKQGTHFTTFAYNFIRGELIDELRRNSPLPQQLLQQIALVKQATQQLPPPCTIDDIASYLGLPITQVHRCLELSRIHGATELRDDVAPVIRDDQDPAAIAEERDTRKFLAESITKLPTKERLVLTMYYLDDMRQKEIATAMNISVPRVSRLLAMAELNLRAMMQSIHRDTSLEAPCRSG